MFQKLYLPQKLIRVILRRCFGDIECLWRLRFWSLCRFLFCESSGLMAECFLDHGQQNSCSCLFSEKWQEGVRLWYDSSSLKDIFTNAVEQVRNAKRLVGRS
ncbi:hypothetical protein [Bartonella sp. CB178]|uniref:hypothetical protein n=1 Tax=Bartonella sp. CB178 TaxID=3112255 RepID=UPI00300DEBAD